jgi:hypothetical protein
MKTFLFKRISWKTVLFASLLFALFIILVLPRMSDYTKANIGSESADSSFFYDGDQLYNIAESYGEDGRSLYILLRWTFDILWPLVYFAFLLSVIVFLCKSLDVHLLSHSYILPFLAMAFDFLENTLVTFVMVFFPRKVLWLGSLAGFVTALKWSLLYASFALIFLLLFIKLYRFLFINKNS